MLRFKSLAISLSVTTVSSILLYLYFKNKMSNIEKKIDTMFKLIQDYERSNYQNEMYQTKGFSKNINLDQNNLEVTEPPKTDNTLHMNNNLIIVSDGEEETVVSTNTNPVSNIKIKELNEEDYSDEESSNLDTDSDEESDSDGEAKLD